VSGGMLAMVRRMRDLIDVPSPRREHWTISLSWRRSPALARSIRLSIRMVEEFGALAWSAVRMHLEAPEPYRDRENLCPVLRNRPA